MLTSTLASVARSRPDDEMISAELVKWIAENLRPFSIVRDRGFLSLMKTGRPGYYIPSPSTVSRDAKLIFARTRQRMAKLLQVSGPSDIQSVRRLTRHIRSMRVA